MRSLTPWIESFAVLIEDGNLQNPPAVFKNTDLLDFEGNHIHKGGGSVKLI